MLNYLNLDSKNFTINNIIIQIDSVIILYKSNLDKYINKKERRREELYSGYVLTPMQKAEYTREMLDKVNADIPLQRQASPEEVINQGLSLIWGHFGIIFGSLRFSVG